MGELLLPPCSIYKSQSKCIGSKERSKEINRTSKVHVNGENGKRGTALYVPVLLAIQIEQLRILSVIEHRCQA